MIWGPAPGQAFKVLGEIVWTKRLRFTLKTKLGIKLVFLSAEDVEKVRRLLD